MANKEIKTFLELDDLTGDFTNPLPWIDINSLSTNTPITEQKKVNEQFRSEKDGKPDTDDEIIADYFSRYLSEQGKSISRSRLEEILQTIHRICVHYASSYIIHLTARTFAQTIQPEDRLALYRLTIELSDSVPESLQNEWQFIVDELNEIENGDDSAQ